VAVSRSVGTLASLHYRRLTGTGSLALLLSLLRVSLVVFLLSRSVQSVPSCRSAYCDASLVANPFLDAFVVAVDCSVSIPPLTSIVASRCSLLIIAETHSCDSYCR
jgi:hypothetical protein